MAKINKTNINVKIHTNQHVKYQKQKCQKQENIKNNKTSKTKTYQNNYKIHAQNIGTKHTKTISKEKHLNNKNNNNTQ